MLEIKKVQNGFIVSTTTATVLGERTTRSVFVGADELSAYVKRWATRELSRDT